MVAICCFCAGNVFASAPTKAQGPEKKIDLESIGFPGVSQAFLDAGGSMLTVHFVDSGHLLVTYAKRGLIPRIADPQEEGSRLVAAKLLDIASGKVLAETEWRLHDHSRYLWNLGQGRFLLRDRNFLSVFAPLATLPSGQPFQRIAMQHRAGDIRTIVVSEDNRLLTLETAAAAPAKPTDKTQSENADTAESPVMLDFFRYSGDGSADSPIIFEKAGRVNAPQPVILPVDADGYLYTGHPGRDPLWPITFQPFEGKPIRLAPAESSCPPQLWIAGRGLALAISCRGATGHVKLLGLDYNEHELWEDSLPESSLPFTLVFAPSAFRVAMCRTESPSGPMVDGAPAVTATQEMRVYQAQTGDLLLKVDASPVFRTVENFDLSSDGLHAAVVREGAIEIYRLKGVSGSDRADFEELAKFAPAPGTGPVRLTAIVTEKGTPAGAAEGGAEGGQTDSKTESTRPDGSNSGDQPARKPPTLLNPGEKPEP